jgi:phosphonate degradation associated HDIG domain protein
MAPRHALAMSISPSIDIVDQLEELFQLHGHRHYEDEREEPVSTLAHALQCAQLAEWASAPDGLVAAALLHDVGHFIAPLPGSDDIDDVHELRAVGLLRAAFADEVIEPVRLHVAAKRYLVAVEPSYRSTLSRASLHTLALQGGAMSADEVGWFEALPFSAQAVDLRRWDDAAKQPGRRTPPLRYFIELLQSVRRRPTAPPRLVIGASDVA